MENHNTRDIHCSHSSLLEINRKQLIGKTNKDSPARRQRAKSYKPDIPNAEIDIDALIYNSPTREADTFIVDVPVGDYIVTVEFHGVIDQVIKLVAQQSHGNVNLPVVRRALMQVRDNPRTDYRVNCTCPDFRYRFRYWATKYGYNYGLPEIRPADIRNPKDSLGSFCKHIYALLNNKYYFESLASKVNFIIKQEIESIREAYDLSEEEFYVQQSGVNLRYKNKDGNRVQSTASEDEIWDS